jgi:O-succinylbenzoic acid--CoA ligase
MIVVDFSSPDFDVQRWLDAQGTSSVLENEGRMIIREWLETSNDVQFKTSGSTGIPKEIRYPKKWVMASVNKTATFFQVNHGAAVLLCLPSIFVAGKMMWLRSFIQKWKLIIVEPKAQPIIPHENIDFAAFTPLQAERLLQHDKHAFERINKAIIGGGILNLALANKLADLPTMFYATFGMTETLTHIATARVEKGISEMVFTAFDGVNLIVDDGGLLRIRVAYFDDLVLDTNDIVVIREPNSFVFVGRADRIVNSGGKKINPELLEARLEEKVSMPFYFCGKADDSLGDALVMMVEGENDAKLSSLFEDWPNIERPKEIYFKEKFRYTPTGKVIKKYF